MNIILLWTYWPKFYKLNIIKKYPLFCFPNRNSTIFLLIWYLKCFFIHLFKIEKKYIYGAQFIFYDLREIFYEMIIIITSLDILELIPHNTWRFNLKVSGSLSVSFDENVKKYSYKKQTHHSKSKYIADAIILCDLKMSFNSNEIFKYHFRILWVNVIQVGV